MDTDTRRHAREVRAWLYLGLMASMILVAWAGREIFG